MRRLLRTVLGLACATAACAAEPWTAQPLGSTDAPYGFLEHLPAANAGPAKKPLIFFMHGLGELGDSNKDLAKVGKYGPLKLIADKDPLGKLIEAQGAIVVAPQGLKPDGWWRTEKLIATLDTVLKRNPSIDLDRIYVTGLSMGGGGTWALATAIPERLAAAVPICGAAKPGNIDKLKELPIWAGHAVGDGTVKFSEHTQAWFDQILTARGATIAGGVMSGHAEAKSQTGFLVDGAWTWVDGGDPGPKAAASRLLLTVYPDKSHDSWTRTYQDKAMWEWLFRQTRAPAKPAAKKK